MDLALTLYLLGLLGVALIAYFLFATFAFGAGYQPTPHVVVEEMLRLAEVGPRDVLYDLGAGTGAIVFHAAAVHRATVLGVEVEPIRVALLRLRRWASPDKNRITIQWANLFDLDFARATVVATFLWPAAMDRLRPKFEHELINGTRVVSYYHAIPGWTASYIDPRNRIFLYRWPDAKTAT